MHVTTSSILVKPVLDYRRQLDIVEIQGLPAIDRGRSILSIDDDPQNLAARVGSQELTALIHSVLDDLASCDLSNSIQFQSRRDDLAQIYVAADTAGSIIINGEPIDDRTATELNQRWLRHVSGLVAGYLQWLGHQVTLYPIRTIK